MRLSIDPSTTPADYDFVHRIRVRFVETDAMGIVHHSNYLAYFEEARVDYLRHVGHPFTEWRDEGWSRRCSSRSSAIASRSASTT